MSRLEHITEEEWIVRALAARGSVLRLAQKSGVSKRQLERYWREKKGLSPIRWLNEVRLRKASALIRAGLSIKEVADALGYEDASYFTKVFKAFHGKLPSEARTYDEANCDLSQIH